MLAEKFLWFVILCRTVVILCFFFLFHFSSVGAYPIQFSEIGLSFSNPVRLFGIFVSYKMFFLKSWFLIVSLAV